MIRNESLLTKMYTQFFSTSRWSAEFVRRSLRHPPKTLNPAPATYPKTLSGATQNLQFRSSFRSPTSHSPPAVPLHRLHRPRLLSAAAAAAAVSDDGLRIQDGYKVTKGDDGKMVSATRKGAAVLDQHIPDRIKQAYHVLQVGDQIYDATLNQTNVGSNNNKFYVIQVLESDAGGHFMVYLRWGRVGAGGQDKLLSFATQGRAIHEFRKKFLEKTSNFWSNRENFKPYAKKYTWIETDYGETEKETNKTEKKGSITDQIKETQLETQIAQFIYLICDISMMKHQMVEIGYNADKLPLGKLSKSTILKGYDVLKRISNVISNPERGQLEQLSGEFYTVIPHDFGFRKMSEFIIDTPQKLKAKLEMVEALGQIEIATKLLEDDSSFLKGDDDSSDQDDPLYTRYKQLRCDFTPLEVDSEEYSMIKTYLINTHEETHSGYTVDIMQIFKMSRHGEAERFQKFASTGNRMLLWHGSRLSNWAGILSQGLRFHMFGKGVYFSDMFSKSANCCYASKTSRSGVLLLCEVALGDMNEVLNGDYKANGLPKGKLSTKRVGQMTPDLTKSRITDDGVLVPLGKPTKHESSEMARLRYNNYIVYNTDQIKMRYALHVTFNFKS